MNNIEKIFSKAVEVEFQEGKNWYQNSRNDIVSIAKQYGINETIAIAVTSALSPKCIWQQNLKDLENVLKYHIQSQGIAKTITLPKVTTYSQNLKKALSVLETGNVDVFKTRKTFNFFMNLLEPDSEKYVTIDGHCINMYYGKLGFVKGKHFSERYYDKIAKQFIRLAKKYSLLPSQFQAITWLAFKRIHNIKVNWRYYQVNLPF